VSLSTALQVECRLNVFLEAKEMLDVWRDGLAEERLVEFTAVPSRHCLQPFVVVFLEKIARNAFPEFGDDPQKEIIEYRVA
jgi:hypothetical protein